VTTSPVAAGRLAGQTALVTGASRGIGRSVAEAFAREGAVVALAARDRPALEEVGRACGAQSVLVPFDVTDEQACTDAVARCEDELGRIDILVNSAGVAESQSFVRTDTALWRHAFEVNVNGPFWLVRAVLPGMLSRGSGAVVSIASTSAKQGFAYVSAYTASKHALLGLTRALAVELPRSGVTFNCVCPFYVDTPMTQRAIETITAKTGRSRADSLEAILPPHGRLVAPGEIAEMCVLLASADGRSINGQGINIDGGFSQA
jgi:NAD(P)-dependent dehydrogenase (short-subunit alcohol dehydrogenase family)